MTTKANIFNALPQHQSDSEDDERPKNSGQKAGEKKGPRVRKTGKNLPPTEADVTAKKAKELRGLDARQTIQKRKESDLDHPHQLDRHSGTGVSAFDKKEKKGGSGPHNWGNHKDDRKFRDRAEKELEEPEVEVEEQEDKTITFEEYAQKVGHQTHQQKNEAKAKISEEQLLKELGKATKLETRKQKQINEHQETHAKRGVDEHNVAPNIEHANLLGFRTGFKTFDDAPRKPRGPRTDAHEKKDSDKVKADVTDAPEVNNEVVGEAGPTAGGEKVEADQKGDSPTGGRGRGGRGGNRGGNRGGEGDRQNRGGYRGGSRGGFGGKKPESKGFNPDDESAFPKLG